MHRIWKALRDRRGFTLIEIAIVIAIIGILLLIALPLFTGARTRAYVAEARQIAAEWKALAWSCLIEKNFKAMKCDTLAEVGWTPPADSDAWEWSTADVDCGDSTPITPPISHSECAADDDTWLAVYVDPVSPGVGIADQYVLALDRATGTTDESPGTGVAITP